MDELCKFNYKKAQSFFLKKKKIHHTIFGIHDRLLTFKPVNNLFNERVDISFCTKEKKYVRSLILFFKK